MSIERRFALLGHGHDDLSPIGHTHDHGTLTGLADNDHPQYPLKAGTETISGAWTFTTDLTIGSDAIVGSNSGTNANDLWVDGYSKFSVHQLGSSSSNIPEVVNNANGIISFNSHDGGYGFQFFKPDNANLWIRNHTAGTWQTWYKIWHSGNDGAGSGLDADLLDGYTTSAGGARYTCIPFVDGTGVLEVGRYIDFHEASGDTGDYSVRLASNSNVLDVSSRVNASSLAVTVGNGIYLNNGTDTYYLATVIGSYGSIRIGGSNGGHTGFEFNSAYQNACILLHTSTAECGFFDSAGWRLNINGETVTTSNNTVQLGWRRKRATATNDATNVDKMLRVAAGFTISNAVYAEGDHFDIYNNSSASITITQGAGLTMRLAGTATTGNRTLAQRGRASVWFNASSECIITNLGGLT